MHAVQQREHRHGAWSGRARGLGDRRSAHEASRPRRADARLKRAAIEGARADADADDERDSGREEHTGVIASRREETRDDGVDSAAARVEGCLSRRLG
jgi:hypothetical protein